MSSDGNRTTENALPTLAAGSAQEEQKCRGDHFAMLTREEINQKLAMLPGLVATGLLTPAKANSMRAVYDSLLRSLNGVAASGQVVADADALQLLRRQPELLRLLEPFLTQAQIVQIVREAPYAG